MKHLTAKQTDILVKLAARGSESAYGLQTSLGTLSALKKRGLLNSRHGQGSFTFPRNGIMWSLTPAGRAISVPAKTEASKDEG